MSCWRGSRTWGLLKLEMSSQYRLCASQRFDIYHIHSAVRAPGGSGNPDFVLTGRIHLAIAAQIRDLLPDVQDLGRRNFEGM